MRLKRGRSLTAFALILSSLAAVCVYAAADRIVFTEQFHTDKVEIRLQEIGPGRDTFLLSNKKLAYTPRIINDGAECYVRVKVDILNGGQCPEPLDTGDLYGLSKGWIRQGEYYYWNSPMKTGNYVDVFHGLHVPENWNPGTVSDLTVSVKAEAVQSRNFEPDFDRIMPWGAVMLQDVAAGTAVAETITEKQISDITFSSAGSFEFGTSDLFEEYKNVLPGDRYKKTFEVFNSSKGDLELQLRIYASDTELNEKLLLDVSCEGTTLFSGTVAGAGQTIQIGDIPEGDNRTLLLEMTLPADADNNYSELVDDVIWQLEAENNSAAAVQTGDFSDMKPFAVTALVSAVLMVLITAVRRKDTKKKK